VRCGTTFRASLTPPCIHAGPNDRQFRASDLLQQVSKSHHRDAILIDLQARSRRPIASNRRQRARHGQFRKILQEVGAPLTKTRSHFPFWRAHFPGECHPADGFFGPPTKMPPFAPSQNRGTVTFASGKLGDWRPAPMWHGLRIPPDSVTRLTRPASPSPRPVLRVEESPWGRRAGWGFEPNQDERGRMNGVAFT
jgi:hypothetical protein